jgi:hypothetical protein
VKWSKHFGTQMTNTGTFMGNGSLRFHFFHLYMIPFLWEAVEAS